MLSSKTPDTKERRIDQWLWYARFFKTRSLASKFVSTGNIRLARKTSTLRLEKPSTMIRIGDILTFMKGPHLKIIEIKEIGTRRGPAPEAQSLYEDRSPPPDPIEKKQSASPMQREPGSGRPTKKERRALDALKS